MYREKQLLQVFLLVNAVTAIKFGTYGREEGSLLMVYKSKGLEVRMLSRSFNPAEIRAAAEERTMICMQISIPKKTKRFVEQAQRESENAQDIYRAYQKDLMKLWLRTVLVYYGLLRMQIPRHLQV
eukprot:TRINITY_DN4491_c0_g1_i1.p1 TRINITY_DN4491_c0_g1~~TRINITY_DN4491_c0_g1_i1.p1  ORF type:complete len:126 (+),score=22.75 TRINITY_DN4491_c0_g1_i1:229-606(+)